MSQVNHNMRPPDSADAVEKTCIVWGIVPSIVWMWWIIRKGNQAYDKAAAELAARTGFNHWWHKNDPTVAWIFVFIGGVCGLVLVFIVAYYIAALQVSIMQRVVDKRKEIQAKQHQHDLERKMQDIERESDMQHKLSILAQCKQELIVRLGTIDQYIRVLAGESDASKRTVALQAAHSQMTTLAAKIASGEISPDAVAAPEVREQASETSKDLARLGMGRDRLNRDLVRIFKLNELNKP